MEVPTVAFKNYDPSGDFSSLQSALRNGGYDANPNLNPQLNAAMRGIALNNAMNSEKSYDIGLSGLEQKLQDQMKMDELNSKKAGPLDWLSGGVGGLNALNSILNKKNLQNGDPSQGLFQNLGF